MVNRRLTIQRARKESSVGVFRFLGRVIIGLLFFGHGTQKLFGWFGGGGPDKTGEMFDSLGLEPGQRHAVAAGTAEAGGGLLFALGALTPLAAATLTSVMITAIKTVHWEKGVWSSQGGYEYNLVLLLAAFSVTENGPGPWSVDGVLGRPRWGTGWALAALAAGAVASGTVLASTRRRPGGQSETPEPATAIA
jgi:putative oxidoreductase